MENDSAEDVTPTDDNPEDVSSTAVTIWAIIALLTSFPVAAFVEHLYDPGRGRAGGVAFGLMFLLVRAFWYLRRHVWFWLTITALIIVHVALVIAIPWTNRNFPAPELAVVGIADFAAMWGFIKLVKMLMTRSPRTSSTS